MKWVVFFLSTWCWFIGQVYHKKIQCKSPVKVSFEYSVYLLRKQKREKTAARKSNPSTFSEVTVGTNHISVRSLHKRWSEFWSWQFFDSLYWFCNQQSHFSRDNFAKCLLPLPSYEQTKKRFRMNIFNGEKYHSKLISWSVTTNTDNLNLQRTRCEAFFHTVL